MVLVQHILEYVIFIELAVIIGTVWVFSSINYCFIKFTFQNYITVNCFIKGQDILGNGSNGNWDIRLGYIQVISSWRAKKFWKGEK